MSKKKIKKRIDAVELNRYSVAPHASEAGIVGVEPVNVREGVNSERNMEEALKIMQDLQKDPKKVEPIVMGTDSEGKLRISKLNKDKYGNFILPNPKEWNAPSLLDKIRKKRKINKIMKHLNPILKRDIGDVTRDALMRKDDEQLDKLIAKLKKKESRGRTYISSRIGCVFIETDDQSIQL